MPYRVKFKPGAEKNLNKIPRTAQRRIYQEIIKLTQNPFIGKKLDGKLKGHFVIRARPYRIIYRIVKEELIVVIIKIPHRQNVY